MDSVPNCSNCWFGQAMVNSRKASVFGATNKASTNTSQLELRCRDMGLSRSSNVHNQTSVTFTPKPPAKNS